MTTLRAGLGLFGRAEEGFALLEVFLEVGRPWVGALVVEPEELRLPEVMTDDRGVVQGVLEEIGREERGRFRGTERAFDPDDPRAAWDYVRVAHCARHAAVWSVGRRTTYFEASEYGWAATYWLPESLKVAYFDAIRAKGWAVPAGWLAAVGKQPKPWWKRGG